MTDFIRSLCDRSDKIFGRRDPWLSFWNELSRQFFPAMQDFMAPNTWGAEFGTDLFDDAPVTMRRDLANSFAPMTRPTGTQWFKPASVTSDDEDDTGSQVREWLDRAARIQRKWMYEDKAGFIGCMEQRDNARVTWGNSVVSVEVNRFGDGLIFRPWHLRDCAWIENEEGEVDQMHRKAQMTARQLRKRYGEDKLHRDIKNACEKAPETEYEIRHVMMTMDDYEYMDGPNAKKYKAKRYGFVSLDVDIVHKEILKDEGSFQFRYVVDRWLKLTGSPYAVSPATCDALGSARLIQVMARTGGEAMEKSVDPPAMVKDTRIRGDINLYAGGLTWVDGDYDEKQGAAMQLFDVGKNAVLGMQALDVQRRRLSEAMYVSKLQLPQNQAKTAYEVQRLQEEYIRSALPIYEPVEQGNAMMLDEVFGILFRQGAFGPPDSIPQELQGAEFRWTMVNPLREASERVKVSTFMTMGQIAQAAAGISAIGDTTIDVHEAEKDAIRGSGAPASWLLSDEEAAKIKEDKANAAAMQNTMQAIGGAGQAAEAVGKGGVAIKDAFAEAA